MTSTSAPTKTMLITGAAKRIGHALALDFAGRGWRIGVHYLTAADEARALVGQITSAGGDACLLEADLADIDAPARVVRTCHDKLGPITCLINNASVFEPDDIATVTPDSWAAHIDTNLRAPVFLAQSFARQLPDNWDGNIINMLDQRVWKPTPQFLSYTASKSALYDLTRTLAQAFAPRIRVNAVGPGPTLRNKRQSKQDFQRQIDATLLQRGTTPEEIGACIEFILSARSMTGQMIALDGGQHLAWQTGDTGNIRE